MVNKPLRPAISEGGTLRGGRLTSHDLKHLISQLFPICPVNCLRSPSGGRRSKDGQACGGKRDEKKIANPKRYTPEEYPSSHNHGSGNGPIVKETNLGGTHFQLP